MEAFTHRKTWNHKPEPIGITDYHHYGSTCRVSICYMGLFVMWSFHLDTKQWLLDHFPSSESILRSMLAILWLAPLRRVPVPTNRASDSPLRVSVSILQNGGLGTDMQGLELFHIQQLHITPFANFPRYRNRCRPTAEIYQFAARMPQGFSDVMLPQKMMHTSY